MGLITTSPSGGETCPIKTLTLSDPPFVSLMISSFKINNFMHYNIAFIQDDYQYHYLVMCHHFPTDFVHDCTNIA